MHSEIPSLPPLPLRLVRMIHHKQTFVVRSYFVDRREEARFLHHLSLSLDMKRERDKGRKGQRERGGEGGSLNRSRRERADGGG